MVNIIEQYKALSDFQNECAITEIGAPESDIITLIIVHNPTQTYVSTVSRRGVRAKTKLLKQLKEKIEHEQQV